ncbi:solute carrier family 35 member F1-like isoform X3 [Phoenix dactylifera]|uniref:Solute carrier family 35 member F1-like isoform X3 n=1 Tax=Phoenix dactylifera TaxID=42345 RepID=A0A8B7C313_PHODC|nr:solute carrier family 35 member F1-like isoform X3 [Phoenix dactylifera]
MARFDGLWSKKTLIGLVLGQFVSLLITSTGFSSSELSRRGINAPTSQSFLNYLMLAFVYGAFVIYRKRRLQIDWYYYLMLAVVDVEANFLAGSNPVKGDMLVIAGSTLYAVSNVSEEFLVKKAERVELMAMLGTFGAVVSACQISILERNELKSIHWTAGAVLPFLGFALAMFLFYSTVPVILKISGSTMLNLSLLTSDMWAVLIRIFAYHQKVDWMYFIAFGAVAVGLVIYSGGSKIDANIAQVAEAKEGDEESVVNNLVQ